jgi:hypothetical protein
MGMSWVYLAVDAQQPLPKTRISKTLEASALAMRSLVGVNSLQRFLRVLVVRV